MIHHEPFMSLNQVTALEKRQQKNKDKKVFEETENIDDGKNKKLVDFGIILR